MPNSLLTIKSLHIYPIKSLAGVEVTEWDAIPTGFKADREYMLVDQKGNFITQRQIPEMVLIQPSFSGDQLVLTHPEFEQTVLSPKKANLANQKEITVKVWRDVCKAFEPDPNVSEWFSDILKRQVRLVSLVGKRPQSSPQRFGEDTTTLFADAAPFLVTNMASLSKLNGMLAKKGLSTVDMRRFRPNIVIDGVLAGFAEHNHRTLETPNYTLSLIDHCQRCIITTINPDNGTRDPDLEPFKTVAELNPMPNNAKSPAFGVNAILSPSTQTPVKVRVGDALTIR